MTQDCVFLSYFGSDVCGERFEKFEQVRQRVAAGLADFPDARWDGLNHFVSGNRGVSNGPFANATRHKGTRGAVRSRRVHVQGGKITSKTPFISGARLSCPQAETRQEVQVPAIHRPVGRYAHAVRYRDLLFISGCGPFDQNGTRWRERHRRTSDADDGEHQSHP
jgi:hypothetical protein